MCTCVKRERVRERGAPLLNLNSFSGCGEEKGQGCVKKEREGVSCMCVRKCVRMCDSVCVNENAARLLTFLWQHELELDCEISSSFPSWCIAQKNTWERRGRYDSLFNPTLSLIEEREEKVQKRHRTGHRKMP